MLPALASAIALRRRALPSGSPPPLRAATVISLINFVNSLPRLASSAPFLCLILCHLECPDIIQILFVLCTLCLVLCFSALWRYKKYQLESQSTKYKAPSTKHQAQDSLVYLS